MMSKAWKFGDDIDTDQIIPGRYLTTFDRDELARHCMEDADPAFADRVAKGDVIVGLKNFGCGSSREHAPLSIIGAGVRAVIAGSFARIFFRNSVNLGLPLFESPEAAAAIEDGDEIDVDFDSDAIVNHTRNERYQARPLPEFAREIMAAGGLMQHVARKVGLKS